MNQNRTYVNSEIRAPQVRLIDASGKQLGIVSIEEALTQAQQAGLDLVEIAPQAKPPVAKIVDWGKYQYEKTKQQQRAKKKQKQQEVKQIRFGLKIGQHDIDIKLGRVRTFLDKGHMVKLGVFFRGREITHPELGYELLNKIKNQLEDVAEVEQEPQLAGKLLMMTVRKKK